MDGEIKEILEAEIRNLEARELELLQISREVQKHKESLIQYYFFKFHPEKKISISDRRSYSSPFVSKIKPSSEQDCADISKFPESSLEYETDYSIALGIESLFNDLQLSTIPLESIAQKLNLKEEKILSVLLEFEDKFKQVRDRIWSLKEMNSFDLSQSRIDNGKIQLEEEELLIAEGATLSSVGTALSSDYPTSFRRKRKKAAPSHRNKKMPPVLSEWQDLSYSDIMRKIFLTRKEELDIKDICLITWGNSFHSFDKETKKKAKATVSNAVTELVRHGGEPVVRVRTGVYRGLKPSA